MSHGRSPRITSPIRFPDGEKKLTEAAAAGLLADSALIAHGRGEAFDYLLQERTCDAARQAIRVCAASLASAKSPVISVNGNTVALAGQELLACAAVLECPIEVNIYYRTPERMTALLCKLDEQKVEAGRKYPDLVAKIEAVKILGILLMLEFRTLRGLEQIVTTMESFLLMSSWFRLKMVIGVRLWSPWEKPSV